MTRNNRRKPSREKALLPGNLKQLDATEYPVHIALLALDQPWLDLDKLSEIQAMGLVWHELSGQELGLAIAERIGAILGTEQDGRFHPTPADISYLREAVPPVVTAIMAAPNVRVNAALKRIMSVAMSKGGTNKH